MQCFPRLSNQSVQVKYTDTPCREWACQYTLQEQNVQYGNSSTLQEGKFHWNINFAISLMANSLNLNSTYLKIFKIFSMIAYTIEVLRSKFSNISLKLLILSQDSLN